MTFVLLSIENLGSTILSKWSRISGFILIIFMGFLMGQGNALVIPDYELYMNSYDFGWSNFESGYTFLVGLGKSLGLEYSDFRQIITIVFSLILVISINRITSNVALVAFLYSISLFVFDTIQIRNFMMLSLVVLAFSFLNEKKIKNYVVSIFIILIATTFHTLAIAFLIPVALSVLSYKIQRYLIMFLVTFELIFVFLMRFIGDDVIAILQIILRTFSSRSLAVQSISSVYKNTANISSGILAIVVSTLQLAIIFYFMSKSDNLNKIIIWMLPMMTLGIISVFVMQISADYCRLLRNTNLFAFIIIAVILDGMHKNAKKINVQRFWLTTFSIVLAVGSFLIQFILYPDARMAIPYIIQLLKY